MYLYKDFEDINADAADTIVYNQGWWQLKDRGTCRGTYCGDEKGDSTSLQREDLQVIDHLFSRATTAVYRTTACCGEEDDDWIDGIEAQNAVAKDVMGAAGVPVADVHGFYGWDDDAATFDGFHANEPEKAPGPPRAAFAEPGGAGTPGRPPSDAEDGETKDPAATSPTAGARARPDPSTESRRERSPLDSGELGSWTSPTNAARRRSSLSPAGSAASPSPRRASAAKLWDDAV
ncbi:hypothetical protein SO694_00041169 [Aureococcus anophagefferens]|uniref:Uncharacterized protein n=1 Tax=Aureococcus anophagefferens TaxID=44056 RepID=A0ABR1G649_AURAN